MLEHLTDITKKLEDAQASQRRGIRAREEDAEPEPVRWYQPTSAQLQPHSGGEFTAEAMHKTLWTRCIPGFFKAQIEYLEEKIELLRQPPFSIAAFWSEHGFRDFALQMHRTSDACERSCPAACPHCAAGVGKLTRPQHLEENKHALGFYDFQPGGAHQQALKQALQAGAVTAVAADDVDEAGVPKGFHGFTMGPVVDAWAHRYLFAACHSFEAERAIGEIGKAQGRHVSKVSGAWVYDQAANNWLSSAGIKLVDTSRWKEAAERARTDMAEFNREARRAAETIAKEAETAEAKRAVAQAAAAERALAQHAAASRRMDPVQKKKQALVNKLLTKEYKVMACTLLEIPTEGRRVGQLDADLKAQELSSLQAVLPQLCALDKEARDARAEARRKSIGPGVLNGAAAIAAEVAAESAAAAAAVESEAAPAAGSENAAAAAAPEPEAEQHPAA